jgi:polyphosphate kinase
MVKKQKKNIKAKKVTGNIDFKKMDRTRFVDRDLSWLKFNERVLSQASSSTIPLLEKVKFLSIYTSNLDEFYMKRVGELKRKIEIDPGLLIQGGQTLAGQFAEIRKTIINQNEIAEKYYSEIVRPKLLENHLWPLCWNELTKNELIVAEKYFDENLFPVLTPLAYDASHPFPFISNLSLSLGIVLKYPTSDERIFARIKIPKFFPQWILINDPSLGHGHRFASIMDIVISNLSKLFPGMEIIASMPFRITRNGDWDPEDKSETIVQRVEEALKDRKFAECIRLQFLGNRNEWMIDLLKEILDIKEEDIYEQKFILDFCDLKFLHDLDLSNLKFKNWSPITNHFQTDDPTIIFGEIAKKDIFVHHPYESFSDSVEKFVKVASLDPNVVAIKMTLYRTNDGSAFVKSLIHAAERGKQVACLVELQARFDEERNLNWGIQLEDAGVHVVYGIPGYKIHTKTALVIRKESDGSLKSYAHVGTGNYNSTTSNFYTDVGIFTCNKHICGDLIQLFHFLTGKSLFNNFHSLLVAPFNMKMKFLDLIDREIQFAKSGKEAMIIAKMNSFDEYDLTEKLYEASCAGVKIKLFVRGFCTLRPKILGLSENIEVFSIIGRFLEHSRIFYFKNNHDKIEKGDFYIGSADWMYRNLQNRVEVITPIESKELKIRCHEILEILIKDNQLKWEMQSNGDYIKVKSENQKNYSTHELLMTKHLENLH